MVDVMQAWAALQPRLHEAARRERSTRAAAWLNLPIDICGIAVLPLTLGKYSLLVAAGNRFLCGGDPRVGDIAQFLWIASPDFALCDERKRKFMRQVGEINAMRAVREIREFLEFHFFDAPSAKPDAKPSNTPLEPWIVHRLGSTYGWPPETIRDMPLPQIFQLLGIMRAADGQSIPSPEQDRVKAEYLRAVNQTNN